MITMAETASAVCQKEACFWTASGPRSADAAVNHEIEYGTDHVIYLTSGGFQ